VAVRLLSMTEAAGEIGEVYELPVRARDLSDLFYQGKLDNERCPIVGRFRVIPRDYLPEVRRVLEQLRERRRAKAEAASRRV
jgi:hypothetical protein